MSSKKKTTTTKDDGKPALVPKLRFPEFCDADGWDVDFLGGICQPQQWTTISATDLVDDGYPVYGANGFIGYYSEFNHDFETVAVTCRGSTCGEVSLIPPKCYITGNSMCLDGIDSVQNSYHFLYQLLKHRGFNDVISGSAQPQIVGNAIKRLRIALPTKREQQKIAECLSSVDELIAAQSRKVDALKTHKKGLMQQLFPREGESQPRWRFPEFQNDGEWEERKLGTVCEIQRGKFSHRPRNDPRFFGGQYPFIQTGDVVKSGGGAVIASQSLNEEGLSVSKLFKPTIVLVTIAANIGDTGLLESEGCFTDSVVGLIPKKDVVPVFLELIMRGQKEYLNKVATTGAQKNINNEILREVSVLLPSVPEQQRIADCLTSLDDLIAAQTQKLDALKTHKKGLMQQLFPSPEEPC